jgi:hypothetical protein
VGPGLSPGRVDAASGLGAARRAATVNELTR